MWNHSRRVWRRSWNLDARMKFHLGNAHLMQIFSLDMQIQSCDHYAYPRHMFSVETACWLFKKFQSQFWIFLVTGIVCMGCVLLETVRAWGVHKRVTDRFLLGFSLLLVLGVCLCAEPLSSVSSVSGSVFQSSGLVIDQDELCSWRLQLYWCIVSCEFIWSEAWDDAHVRLYRCRHLCTCNRSYHEWSHSSHYIDRFTKVPNHVN